MYILESKILDATNNRFDIIMHLNISLDKKLTELGLVTVALKNGNINQYNIYYSNKESNSYLLHITDIKEVHSVIFHYADEDNIHCIEDISQIIPLEINPVISEENTDKDKISWELEIQQKG